MTAEIERLVDEGVSRAELAVFYRTNAQSRVLEDMLVRAQIGYQVIGGTKFYERAEIKDAVAYLTFLVNPADGGAFTRIANAPKRGIGQTSLSRVLAHAETMGDHAVGGGGGARTTCRRSAPPPGARSRASCRRSSGSRSASTAARRSPRCSRRRCARPATSTRSRPSGRSRRRAGSRTSASSSRSRASTTASRARGRTAGVAEFLQQISLIADADTLRDDEGLVTLMTLHNAKGLEFPIVFMIGCEDGVFPHSRALDEGSLEEERRLAYVGITRAMRDLYITYARRRNVFGDQSFGVRSRFIDEIPRELTDQPDRNAVGAGRPAGLGRVASWGTAAAASAEVLGEPAGGGAVFRVGDDVVHAAFGDGVVTGVEPGGIVVVNFAGEGRERKLMADYAPIRRR